MLGFGKLKTKFRGGGGANPVGKCEVVAKTIDT